MTNTFLIAAAIASALPKGSCREANKWLARMQVGDKPNRRKQANRFFSLHKPSEDATREIIAFIEEGEIE